MPSAQRAGLSARSIARLLPLALVHLLAQKRRHDRLADVGLVTRIGHRFFRDQAQGGAMTWWRSQFAASPKAYRSADAHDVALQCQIKV